MCDIIPHTIEIYSDDEIRGVSIPPFSDLSLDFRLFEIVSRAYRMSLKKRKNIQILDYLLSHIIKTTNSKSGIICIRKYNDDNTYRLESLCVQIEKEGKKRNLWHDQIINILESNKEHVTFHNNNNLFGRGLQKEVIVLCNDYKNDPRRSEIPQGHIEVRSFYSIPIGYKGSYIGVINLSNGDYDMNTLPKIFVLLESTAYFINKAMKPSLEELRKDNVEELKDDFLSMISHEIRTPLTGIVSMAQLIPEAGELNDKQKEYISQQNICIHQLLELLNDLIDFQTLKSDRLKLHTGTFNLKECVETAIIVIKDKAVSKNLELRVRYKSPKYPSRIVGDMQRLRQILINLLSNAVKFTENGSIKIVVKATPEINKNDKERINCRWMISIAVIDTGIGIPKSEQNAIFSMFKQGEANRSIHVKRGMGLGLAISKSLVELMGGDIRVESEGIPGEGSTFILLIPFEEEVEVTDILSDNRKLLKNASILAVDDKKQNRIVINEYLFKWGCRPVTVESAEEALQHIRSDTAKKLKVILIDIHMPLMSGIELAQKIKYHKIPTPLIALSSIHSSDHSVVNLFDFYLYKPLVEHQLLKCVVSCLKNGVSKEFNGCRILGSTEIVKKKEELKVLIADDDQSNRYSVKELLISLGLKNDNVRIVDNGKSCVSEVSRHFYDVVFMDIKMPVMNGIEATKIITKLDRTPTIIAISAGVDDVNKEKCQQVGMSGYLVKPISRSDLLQSLSGFLCPDNYPRG